MRQGIPAAVVLLLGVVATESRAGFLTVLNPGFESPGYEYVTPTGWTEDQSPGNFLDYENHLRGQLLPPPGTDVGNWSAFTSGAGSGSQIIGNYTMVANTTYTLDALVGGRLDSSGDGFGGSTIELFDADTSSVLAAYTLHRGAGSAAVNGFFQLQSASFSTGQFGGPVGDRLGIRLIGLGEGSQTWFDNVDVQVATSAVPEPSSVVMLGLGAAGILGYLRRKTKTSANLV